MEEATQHVGKSLPFLQFCCEHKTVVKNKVFNYERSTIFKAIEIIKIPITVAIIEF